MENETKMNYYIVINEYDRARLVQGTSAKDAVVFYEETYGPQVRQVMPQPNATGNHVDVRRVEHDIVLK